MANEPNQGSQSEPSSPKSVNKSSQKSAFKYGAKSQGLCNQQSESTSSLSNFFRKITRFKRSPWILNDFHKKHHSEELNKKHSSKTSIETKICGTQSGDCKGLKSNSESKIQHVVSPKQKTFQELKSLIKLGGGSTKKEKNKSSNEETRSDNKIATKPPVNRTNIKLSSSFEAPKISPKRLVCPPQSLDLKNRITIVHNINKSSNKMTSMDSIGTCSLDLNTEKLSVTANSAQRSISERSLKGSTVLEETPSSSKSLHTLKNGHRLPSYVGISCTISGYKNYTRYCSSSLKDSLKSDQPDGTPSLTTMTPHSNSSHEPVNWQNNYKTHHEGEYDELNSISSNFKESSFHQFDLDDKNIFKNIHSQFNFGSDQNAPNGSSIVQQRIASLYGEQFAAGWRQSRTKNKYKQYDLSKFHKPRSPSCPPQRNNENDTQTNQKTKSPPVFRHITKLFLEQLETADEEESIQSSQSDNYSNLSKPVVKVEVEVPCTTKSIEMNIAQNKQHDVKDGNWFLSELNRETLSIKEKVDQTEKILSETNLNEEIAGKLRAAIGKANLLMSKKLTQFKELCYKNINQDVDEQFQTKNEDLAGFWDMVLIQITDINETFEEIKNLRENGWEYTGIESPKINTPTKLRARRTPLTTPKSSPSKSNSDKSSSDDSSRDVERRNKLKEAKRKQAKLINSDTNNVTIFTTPTTSKDS